MTSIKQLKDYLVKNNCTIGSLTLGNSSLFKTQEDIAKAILLLIEAPVVNDIDLI